jgi:hypothetical protein
MRRAPRVRPRGAIRALLLTVGLVVALSLLAAEGAAGQEPELHEQVLFQAGTGGYSCFRIPAIVEATDGTLLALPEGRVTDCGLDGVEDFVEVPWSPSLDMAAGDFTWTSWIRYSATTGSHAILWAYRVGSGTPGVWLRAEPGSNRIRGFMETERGNAQVVTKRAYNDGAWHFLTLQRDSGRFSLSVDGQERVASAAPDGSVTAGKELAIDGIHVGQRLDGVHRFRGAIDEVRVHARALTASQIASIEQFNEPIKSGLRLWLRLDRITPLGGEQ